MMMAGLGVGVLGFGLGRRDGFVEAVQGLLALQALVADDKGEVDSMRSPLM